MLKELHQQKGVKLNLLYDRLQFNKGYQFLKLNERDLIKSFIDEFYSKPSTEIYPTNKTIIKSIDNNWSSDLLGINDYGPKNNRGYRYIIVVIDNFSNFG